MIRPAVPDDAAFLTEMLAVAVDWRPGAEPRPVPEIMAEQSFAHYISGWPREGDRGVVAEVDGAGPVGAAWWRWLSREDPGYGFVDASIPEITVGVAAHARRQGIGRALLDALVAEARRARLPALSLSVEPDNHARGLYAGVGFRPVGASGGSVTMLLPIAEPTRRGR